MSVWKKASKVNQKVHRERSQPAARRQLGFLEKHKDYKKRAVNHNNQEVVLKALQKRALDKNPDEFYYHMINSKVHDGVHHERETKEEDTPEQIQLMQSQDLKYIEFKRTLERKKIERLQSQLHLSSVNQTPKNTHKYFKGGKTNEADNLDYLMNVKLPKIDLQKLKRAAITRKQAYVELSKRIERERQLNIVQQKLYIKKQLNGKNVIKPKKVKRGNKNDAPVYKWKYERKT